MENKKLGDEDKFVEDFLPELPVRRGVRFGLDRRSVAINASPSDGKGNVRFDVENLQKTSTKIDSLGFRGILKNQKSQRSTSNSKRMITASQRFQSFRSSGFNRSQRLLVPSSDKPKILAIHGKTSNSAVTKLQLANLHITEEKYDIIYLDGLVEEERGDPSVEQFVTGPFFSWYHDKSDDRFISSFIEAVVHVYKEILKDGPFDIIYGFSQGATLAAAVAAAHSNANFRNRLLSLEADFGRMRKSTIRTHKVGKGVGRTSFMKSISIGTNYAKSNSFPLTPESFEEMPCEYMILACASEDPSFLNSQIVEFPKDEMSVDIASFHIIGVTDSLKATSEKMTNLFSDAQIAYIHMAEGHSISKMASDSEMLRTLYKNLHMRKNVVTMNQPKMVKASDVTSIGVMYPFQVVGVELSNLIPHPTILNVLKSKNPLKPLFYNARDSSKHNYTTYGDVVKFIESGDGDLRRLGVQPGDVVAYGAPPSGGAVPALAFLSIMSQVTAAPLAPSTSESDALDLLSQFSPTHLILFEGIENKGVESAFIKFASSGRATLHRASIINDPSKPGMFRYSESGSSVLPSLWGAKSEPLRNPVDGIALLLGTSGTTSKPKAVPIEHGSIVQNGYILGRSLGITDEDVCYSIMPLFHIGGISASILCSVCIGSSICCDPSPFNPEDMVDALAYSNPQPTWYSSVPTIHNATVSFIRSMVASRKMKGLGVSKDGIWITGHSLKFIRSGAAALLGPDALALSSTFGNIPIIPTYSMSEQMPITQPFQGKMDMISDKPNSVGVPVATSLAVVNSSTLSPVPFGVEGEIAISGSTVMTHYLNNEEANAKSFFELTLPLDADHQFQRGRYFLTGDVGVIDKDGYLTLKGRNKELIKKGGEQISPFEIEEPMLDHPWVEVAVCFSVTSKLYGEEVGLAIVLSDEAPFTAKQTEVSKVLRSFLKMRNVNPKKWPTKWKIVTDDELPKTKSKKYIRVGLAKKLGLEEVDGYMTESNQAKMASSKNNTLIDWGVISGFRFLLACYVMFMHIGSNASWGLFNNLRGWPWHVHVFFLLGGFSLVAPMNPVIEKKFKYFMARFMAMYPMYIVALLFVFANLLVACRPSTFRSTFHWDSQPNDLYIDGNKDNGYSELFCEGTPATPHSYWASLFLTLIVYLFGVAITPLWVLNWWAGYYFWFSSMYYQCLMIFPTLYNKLTTWRSNTKFFLKLMTFLQGTNLLILLLTWFLFEKSSGYNHYDEISGDENNVEEFTDGKLGNWIGLGWYLFSPFWMLYFVIGACTAFLYDSYRPAERSNNYIWGYIGDGCTVLMIAWSVAIVCQGNVTYDALKKWELRPATADNYTDVFIVNRIWDNISGRLVSPITTLWIFALATGEGVTASILRSNFLVEYLAPHAYNCFLFHQPVGQWYYAVTRRGLWWNWWSYRKTMYWFSPGPCPVEWYEYFYLVMLTVLFSSLMNVTAEPLMAIIVSFFRELVMESDEEDLAVEDSLITTIEEMTGFTPEFDWTLDQCGLSSVGLPQLALRIRNAMSTATSPISISASQLSDAQTVGDICEAIKNAILQANADGI